MYIQFHITDLCNFKCKHCYMEDYAQETMSIDNFKWAIDKIVTNYRIEFKQKGVIALIGGEPLVLPNFMDYFDYVKTLFNQIRIATNGSLLTDDMCEQFRKAGNVEVVQISLEGPKYINDIIRGKGNFDRAIAGAKIASEHGLYVIISYTINQWNYDKVPELVAELNKLKVARNIWFDRMIPINNNIPVVTTEQYKMFFDDINRLHAENGPGRIKVVTNRAMQVPEFNNYICAACNMGIICPNGDMLACRRMPIKIGNIFEDDFMSVIKCKKTRELRKSVYAIPDECSECKFKETCRGGLKCLTYAVYGNLNHADVNCPVLAAKKLNLDSTKELNSKAESSEH